MRKMTGEGIIGGAVRTQGLGQFIRVIPTRLHRLQSQEAKAVDGARKARIRSAVLAVVLVAALPSAASSEVLLRFHSNKGRRSVSGMRGERRSFLGRRRSGGELATSAMSGDRVKLRNVRC